MTEPLRQDAAARALLLLSLSVRPSLKRRRRIRERAGHASMATTEIYLHLAGVAFHDEAAALERRLGLDSAEAPDFVPAFVPDSRNLREPQETSRP